MILNSNNFEEFLGNNSPAIIDFWAEWCGPCKKMKPILEELESEFNVIIGKVDADESADIASKYNVSSIPTIIVFEDKVPVKTIVGAMPKHKLIKELEGWI